MFYIVIHVYAHPKLTVNTCIITALCGDIPKIVFSWEILFGLKYGYIFLEPLTQAMSYFILVVFADNSVASALCFDNLKTCNMSLLDFAQWHCQAIVFSSAFSTVDRFSMLWSSF